MLFGTELLLLLKLDLDLDFEECLSPEFAFYFYLPSDSSEDLFTSLSTLAMLDLKLFTNFPWSSKTLCSMHQSCLPTPLLSCPKKVELGVSNLTPTAFAKARSQLHRSGYLLDPLI